MGVGLVDIFISYSSKHRDLTSKLAERLAAEGYTIWWDCGLESWGSYETQIRAALADARVVVVIWSEAASNSDWVYSEAKAANSAGKLVNALPKGLPYSLVRSPFDAHHIDVLDLDEPHRMLRSIRGAWEGRPGSRAKPLHESYRENYGIDLFEPKRTPLSRAAEDLGPSDLLQARHEAVDYIRGTGHLEEVLAWCRDPARRTAGRLIHGAGGFGKTRMMIEAARLLRAESWLAGFLPLPPESVDKEREAKARRQALEQVFALGDEPGVLLIIDYAEGRQGEARDLARLMTRRPAEATRPVRLVLLARGADWWREFFADLGQGEPVFRVPGQLLGDVQVITTIPEGQQRLDFFVSSVAAFEPHMKRMAETGSFTGWDGKQPDQARLKRIMREPSFARPLALQMEAMLFLASSSPEPGAIGVDTLLGRILDLEQAHWQKLLGPLPPERRRDLVRGVAQVTVVQGVTASDATQRLLMADGFYKGRRSAPVDVDGVLVDLHRVYGRAGGGVAPLEPDLLGEHHVVSLDRNAIELIEGCLSWIEAEPEDKRKILQQNLLTVLQRATQPEHGAVATQAEALLDHLIREHCQHLAMPLVAVMLDTPGALIALVQGALPHLDRPAVATLSDALPLHSLVLRTLAYAVARRCVDLARSIPVTPDQIAKSSTEKPKRTTAAVARSLDNLAIRAVNLGRRDEALFASQEAVDAYRELVEADPNGFLPDLASSLNIRGKMLSEAGRHDEALAASQQAVWTFFALAKVDPNAFRSDLALSRNNLGSDLTTLGRHDEALAVIQDAVSTYRDLAKTNPDAFLPFLAMSLANQGRTLSRFGRHAEALDTARDAVDAYRHLAKVNPDAFLPDLAMSLNNLGNILSDLWRDDEALATIQEAVDAFRSLVSANPDTFLPDLAMSLNNQGRALSDLGRCDEALTAIQEAVNTYRILVKANPDATLRELARSLVNEGRALSDLDRHDESLAVTAEAVAIYRTLAKASPDAFLPDLSMSLSNLGMRLSNLGRHYKALDCLREGLAIIAPFAEAHPDAHGALASALSRAHADAAELAGCEPDTELLKRIANAIGA